MNKKILYIWLGFCVLLLIGIGLILDRVGGFGIRTDDISSTVTLSFSEPMLLGVPLTVRWQGEDLQNIGVTLQLVAESESLFLGQGQLLAGSMPILIPCTLPSAPYRLELIDATSGAILAVSPVETLSPGPDCVR